MVKVKEIMKKYVVSVDPKISVSDAAKIMSNNNIGSVIITQKMKPVGIVTNDDIVSAIAINQADTSNQIIDIQPGELQWTATEGQWRLILIKHDFRSSPTRAVNNPTRGKDPSNSLLDYLDPAATLKFLEFTHEEHKKRVGSEFGKTVLVYNIANPYSPSLWFSAELYYDTSSTELLYSVKSIAIHGNVIALLYNKSISLYQIYILSTCPEGFSVSYYM